MKLNTKPLIQLRIYLLLLIFSIVSNFYGQNYPDQQNLDDITYQSYQSPSTSYPQYLQTFVDSQFGYNVTRVSDKDILGTTTHQVRHNYSVDQPWNSDGSLIKLAGYPAAILDGDTFGFIRWSDIPGYGRWSNLEPNIIFGTTGNRFVRHNVTTNQSTTLHTFSNYSSIDFGYGKGNQDNNDKYVGLIGRNGSNVTLITYDIELDLIIGTLNLGDLSNADLGWFSVSPLGNYAVVNWHTDGNGQYEGIQRYNLDFTNGQHIYDYTAHGDLGIDANGNEVFVQYGNEANWSQDYYLVMIRISDGLVTPLFHFPSSIHGTSGIWGGHISCRNNNRPGWAYVSEGCCTDHPVASREIFAIKLDGSNIVERYVKHHSDFSLGYGHQAHAVPNRNGTKVMFASNWNNTAELTNDTYAPSWIVEIPQVENSPEPLVANAGADVTICQGEQATLNASGGSSYLWSTGETTQSITVQPDSTTEYSVTVFEGNASDADEVVVTVNPLPIVNAGENQTICEGESVTLVATGGNSFQWNTGQNSSAITVSPSETTIYTVTVSQNGCASQAEVTVTVIPRQTINAGNDVTIDQGESVTLTVAAEGEIHWSTGESTSSINVSPTETTTYSVTAYLNGCISEDSVTVFVNGIETVVANAGEDVEICRGESTTLTASGGSSFLWSTGETTESIEVNPNNTTNYTVTVSNGISSDSDTVKVFVNNCNPPSSLDVDDDNSFQFSFNVYPNPTHGIIHLKLSNYYQYVEINIYDITGKVVLRDLAEPSNVFSKQYDLSHFERGIYLFTVYRNGETFTKRIVLN